ncbi:MAG: site-2 protease family protein [Chloroflexi bacterium]|jgi:Zn-dependent protease|nr:site-2 protease family protein [Chloroflexota bacterium]MBT3669312.1 site-2 protease family protein [Chloroflexota bacterium]MBT4003489.1 site-2 protease family protein [Chloroflexota bacterium]MBT4306019.1 site-2 protease family protein [Chloroflexota bacterium]MBT4532663.1 site-2 protease family protein [Chloroflexota bacterium]
MSNMPFPMIFSLLFVLLISFSVHEYAHALVADIFGDDTPAKQGRLTLNPLAHLDIIGSLFLLNFGFGWAKPVEVNPYTLERRSKSARMWVSLAGPISNVILALLAAFPIKIGLINMVESESQLFPSLYEFLTYFIFFNFVLAFFNLLPIFPLDGEKVLIYFLPDSGKAFMDRIRGYSYAPLFVLLWVLPFFGFRITDWFVFAPAQFLAGLLS